MKKYEDVLQDRNGNVISGATVTVTDYPSGTTSTVYAANAIGANANPLTTDSDGTFSFFAKDGRYNLTISKTGITSETVSNILIQDTSGVVSVAGYGAVGDGTTDDTAAIQAAINAAAGAALFFPEGQYKITSALNVTLGSVKIYAEPFSVTIYIATANTDGIVIGDGTAPTAALVNSTTIQGIQFVPFTGSSASTSGACVFVNRASYFEIRDCSFVGSLSAVNKLWNAISVIDSIEWKIRDCIINGFVNNGIRCVGTSAVGVVDGLIANCLVVAITGDGIYFGDYTAAINVNSPYIYSYGGWGIKVECTAVAGRGINYLISQPNIEATTVTSADGGVYFKAAASGQIVGGWFGGTAGVRVDSTAGSIFMLGVLNQCLVPYTLSGAACSIIGCDTTGDNATTTTGIAVAATATDTNIVGGRIRQFTTAGVAFTGAPARCTVSDVNFVNNGTNITGTPTDINATAAPIGSTTPTPTAGAGAFTTVSAAVAWTKASNRVTFDATVTITTNGTAASDIRIPLPFSPAITTAVSGVVVETGKTLMAYVDSTGGGRIVLNLYDGTYPGADGRTMRVSGSYRV